MVSPPPLPADAPRVGEGRYVLLTRLGEGGMAVVYGAWDEDLRIWRAVKVLLPEYAKKGSVRRRFEREAQTMMAIRHTNLVRVIEVRVERALPYMVMDLVPGGSWQDWALRHGAMPSRMATEAAIQVCDGLAAVHEAGVVHRDVKPQNVLVDLDGTCKLTDFGVAQVDGGDTKTGVAMGTLGYMAPEQLADSKSVDPRCDIYSLGASIYVLVTRATVRDLFRVADDPQRLEGVPPVLSQALSRCLQYEREDRFATIQELKDALVRALPELPPLDADVHPLPRGPNETTPGVPANEFTELQGMLEHSQTTFTDEVRAPVGELTPLIAFYTDEPRSENAPKTPDQVPSAGTTPAPKPSTRSWRGLQVVAAITLLLSIAGFLVLLAVVPLALGYGGLRVSDAATVDEEATGVLVGRAADAGQVLEQLQRRGVDVSAGRSAAMAFDASSVERREVALQLADALSEAGRVEFRAGPPLSDSDAEVARQKLHSIEWAAERARQARETWTAEASSPLGRVVVAAGLAEPPPADETLPPPAP